MADDKIDTGCADTSASLSADDTCEIAFSLILHAGNSRSQSIQAVRAAEKGEFDRAAELLSQADDEMHRAHEIQTRMLQDEMNGRAHELSLAMVHAQDHLSMATTQRESAAELIELMERVAAQQQLIERLAAATGVALTA